MAGERDLILALSRLFGPAPEGVTCGIGDDTAIVAPAAGFDLLWTIDSLLEGVHFDLSYTPLTSVGWKALAVNLSDIAAMGGEPLYALLSLGWPPSRDLGQALELAQGLQEAGRTYGVAIIGGDTIAAPAGLMLSLTVLGQIRAGEALRRQGAQVGDGIYVTGPLGLAAAGLEMFRAGLTLPETERQVVAAALLRPCPQLAAGQLLARHRLATAAIDLSDGVASDLAQICRQSQVGAMLTAVPYPTAVQNVAEQLGVEPVKLALAGGEDYQLLFTVSPRHEAELPEVFRAAGLPAPLRLGEIVRGNDIRLQLHGKERRISDSGFDHFPQASLPAGSPAD